MKKDWSKIATVLRNVMKRSCLSQEAQLIIYQSVDSPILTHSRELWAATKGDAPQIQKNIFVKLVASKVASQMSLVWLKWLLDSSLWRTCWLDIPVTGGICRSIMLGWRERWDSSYVKRSLCAGEQRDPRSAVWQR